MADMTGASRMAVAVRPQSAATDVVEIDVYDEIGIDFWTGEGVTAKAIRDSLKGSKPKIIKLSVNSGGGDAFEGVAIYNVLRQYGEKGTRIVGEVTGIAASAASIVLAAADEVSIPANAAIMVHEAWTSMRGNAGDLEKRAGLLRQINDTAADTYVRSAMRRGVARGREDMLALMAEETWMFGSEAVDAGFADTVTDSLQAAASVDLSHYRRAAEMAARLPIPAPREGATETNTMSESALQAERDSAQASKDAAAAETQTALEVAAKVEAERDALRDKLAALEAERDVIAAREQLQAERVAELAADLNRREVSELLGTKLYPAELEPMVQLRAREPELFSALMAARPSITLTATVIGDDKPENTITADPDSRLAATVRDAAKDE
jgi:ATP-dependent Clp protease, protease subunit